MSIQEDTEPVFERIPEGITYHEVDVRDPFETAERSRIEASLAELEAMGFYGNADTQAALERKRLSSIDYSNPATQEFLRRVPGVEHWLSLVPTPRALSPLYNPSMEMLPDGHVIGDELRAWMIAIADARGLRHRSHIVTQLLSELTLEKENTIGPSRWLSVASGAAQPVLEAAQDVYHASGSAPRMTLADLDSSALTDAMRMAQQLGLGDVLNVERMNVLSRQGLHAPLKMAELAMGRLANRKGALPMSRHRLPAESFDVVEAVGILEYLKPEDWPYRYNGVVRYKTIQAGAVRLVQGCYDMLKPGGDLIVGNMLTTHPQLGFTLNTVQWPHIQPRSISEMMDIFSQAGLEAAPKDVYVSSDPTAQVYALYRIHKPEYGRDR